MEEEWSKADLKAKRDYEKFLQEQKIKDIAKVVQDNHWAQPDSKTMVWILRNFRFVSKEAYPVCRNTFCGLNNQSGNCTLTMCINPSYRR